MATRRPPGYLWRPGHLWRQETLPIVYDDQNTLRSSKVTKRPSGCLWRPRVLQVVYGDQESSMTTRRPSCLLRLTKVLQLFYGPRRFSGLLRPQVFCDRKTSWISMPSKRPQGIFMEYGRPPGLFVENRIPPWVLWHQKTDLLIRIENLHGD